MDYIKECYTNAIAPRNVMPVENSVEKWTTEKSCIDTLCIVARYIVRR